MFDNLLGKAKDVVQGAADVTSAKGLELAVNALEETAKYLRERDLGFKATISATFGPVSISLEIPCE